MRGEVLGAERRRRWTAEQKARIVAESFGSGEPVSWVARRHDLSTSQLFAWRKAAKDGTDAGLAAVAAAFLPVEVTEDPDAEGDPRHGPTQAAYTPPVLPPIEAPSAPAGSVVPFRRQGDDGVPTSEGQPQASTAEGAATATSATEGTSATICARRTLLGIEDVNNLLTQPRHPLRSGP